MNFSYWETETFLNKIDYTIVGSGIVGLSCALALREKHPNARIIVLERSVLPNGASTKNAGFACFGSVSEILNDLETHTPDEVLQLLRARFVGLQKLRARLGDQVIDFKQWGGYELFLQNDPEFFEQCMSQIPMINEICKDAFSVKKEVFSVKRDGFCFKNIEKSVFFNSFEGQVDTGKMLNALIKACHLANIFILNTCEVENYQTSAEGVILQVKQIGTLETKKLCIATNGFAQKWFPQQLTPARAQVLVTKPISNLHIKGTFHLDKGYYYFRNIHNRILLGGGRNLDFEGETTTEMATTKAIQSKLESLLYQTILPNQHVEIDTRWSGIMGLGDRKKPIVQQVDQHVYCGIRLGGMGVAIGYQTGEDLAHLAFFKA